MAARAILHLPTSIKGRGEASGIAIVMIMAVKQSILIFSLILLGDPRTFGRH